MSSRMAILRSIEARKTELEVAQSVNDGEESQTTPDDSREQGAGDAGDGGDEPSPSSEKPKKATRSSARVKRSLPARKGEKDETTASSTDAKPAAKKKTRKGAKEDEGDPSQAASTSAKTPAAKQPSVTKKTKPVGKEGDGEEGDPNSHLRIYREDIDTSTDVILCSTWGGGNIGVYTQVLNEWWERYEEAAHSAKNAVCEEVVKEMFKRGTRFLIKVENSSGEDYFLAESKDSEKVKKRVLRALRKEVVERTNDLSETEKLQRKQKLREKRLQKKRSDKAGKLPPAPKAPPSLSVPIIPSIPEQAAKKKPLKIPKGTIFSTTPEGTIIVTTKRGVVEVGGTSNTIKTIPAQHVEQSAKVLAQDSLPLPPSQGGEEGKSPAIPTPGESAEV